MRTIWNMFWRSDFLLLFINDSKDTAKAFKRVSERGFSKQINFANTSQLIDML